MNNKTKTPDFEELDKIAARAKLSDATIAGRIVSWGRKQDIRVVDEIAVAYRLGYLDGKKSNEERVAKAFKKLHPELRKTPDDIFEAVEAEGGELPEVPGSITGNALDPAKLAQHEEDVITPNGNMEVEEYAESDE